MDRCLIEHPFCQQQRPHIAVRLAIVWPELENLREMPDCIIELLLASGVQHPNLLVQWEPISQVGTIATILAH